VLAIRVITMSQSHTYGLIMLYFCKRMSETWFPFETQFESEWNFLSCCFYIYTCSLYCYSDLQTWNRSCTKWRRMFVTWHWADWISKAMEKVILWWCM
jgi:hypothetical protein